jgi:hypothetical protein
MYWPDERLSVSAAWSDENFAVKILTAYSKIDVYVGIQQSLTF